MTDLTPRAEKGAKEPGQAAYEEHPTNDTLERIGAFGRSCSVGKHQATNWVHLRATVDALDAAGHREAADTLIWQVWHRVNSRARYQEFYNLGTSAEDAAEARAATAEAEVERLKTALGASTSFHRRVIQSIEADVARLRGRVAVLEEALKPFAIAADVREPIDKDRADNIACFSGLCAPLVGHFRAARTALQGGNDV